MTLTDRQEWEIGKSRTFVVSKVGYRSPYEAQSSISQRFNGKYFNVRRYDYACGFDDKGTMLNHDDYWYFKIEPNKYFFKDNL